ncbi:MAG: chromosome segregation protein SMC [Saprospiraceae bacterium]|nr:chromosome segregation protein SMC [Pyrinomonadaceae bacterium]
MFKLQRLEITGFKSFADYTEIVFTGNGITAVVGPNGCGKSNVSDCISWVLGEQRAKTLRGAEMKDVIFQGSKNRKPSGMAEVVLHLVRDDDFFDTEEGELEDIDQALGAFDEKVIDLDLIEGPDQIDVGPPDSNGFHSEEFEVETVQALQVGSVQTVEKIIKAKRHWRPRSVALEFAPGEAVSVTRRLYLSGESEYQLNGKNCRLRDIQDLFAGTGLSGSHYAIIEQGRIGQILSAKPSDRRTLIEEAAGISKFRTRQRAAEARLDSAKTNLGRISDIVSEIESQANSLRRQAGKTKRFVSLQEEFRVLLRTLFAAEGRHLSNLIDDLQKRLTQAVAIEHQFAAKVMEKEEGVREGTRNARLAEENLAEVRRKHAENALERDRSDREHRYQSEQILNLNNRLQALRGESESATHRLNLVESEFKRLRQDEEKEGADADASRLILVEAEKQYAEKIEDVQQIEGRLEFRRGELLKHTAAVERFDEIDRQMKMNLERISERATGLVREGIRAEETLTQHHSDAGRLAGELDSELKKLESLQTEKNEILAVTASARDALRQSDNELRTLQNEFSRTKNRLETLQELEEKRAVYAPQIQKLFAAQDSISIKLKGVLADFLKVDERAEKAVESLFGPFLQTVLVESAADSTKVSKWVRANEIGRIVSLAASDSSLRLSSPKEKTSGSKIEDLLGVSSELREILRKVFPREMSAIMVENFEEAKTGDVLVNHDGDLLIGGVLSITGMQGSDQKNSSLLAFKRELAGLEKSATELEKSIAAAESESAQNRKILTEREEKTVDLQSLIIKVERGILGFEVQRDSLKQDIERANRHLKVVSDESTQIASEIEHIQNQITEAAANRDSAESLRTEAQSDLECISQSLIRARENSETENAVLNEKRTQAATSSERRRSVQAALRRIESEQKELESRIAQQNIEVSEAETIIRNLRISVSDIAGKIASVNDDETIERTELNAAVTSVQKSRGTADSMGEELAELNRKSADALNERAAIEVRQTEAVTRLRSVNEKCSQDLNRTLAEIVEESEELESDVDLDYTRKAVGELRQRLDGFGAINMLAVEELTDTEDRLSFLVSQRQDIIDSIESAEEALREIKERSRAKFKQAFEVVNANFVEFFRELFGGGRGEMTLLESDDILEAGIEVVAQPPGKRLQNILLLSGGEKAMTAIALVLAIFKYRPSPFCLLDEVDAPLDDANVGRFVNKIAEMSEKTQFIVITHNKRTMEAARALYGVTMQEAGVSKVVSVKFD